MARFAWEVGAPAPTKTTFYLYKTEFTELMPQLRQKYCIIVNTAGAVIIPGPATKKRDYKKSAGRDGTR